MPSLATFNANNFFLRYRFSRSYPGDMSQRSMVEANAVASLGYLPQRSVTSYGSRYIVWDHIRRDLASYALLEPDGQLPDILCFQEVENIQAIRKLNEEYLGGYYGHSLLIDAYDPRNIDVGMLSVFPIAEIRSHIEDVHLGGARPFENRDCLEVTLELPANETLTLFVNHFKSKLVRRSSTDTDATYRNKVLASHQKRLNQATEVERLVRQRFAGQHNNALYAVIGDFNDTPESPWVAPLVTSNILTDIVAQHRPQNDRWTYYYRSRNRVSQIDYILVSQALRTRIDAVVAADPARAPHIERSGLGFREWSASSGDTLPSEANLLFIEDDGVTPVPANATPPTKVPFRFQRYQYIIDDWRNNISDHCPVKVWF